MKRNHNEQLVVVLSRSFATGIGIIRALGAEGYMVDLIASSRIAGLSKFASKSKYLHDYQEIVSAKFRAEGETDEELVNALMAYRGRYERKPVLFPTDDYTVSIMDQNRTALGEIFQMPGVSGGEDGSLTKAMDKMYQSNMAKEAGLLTPAEWLIPLNVQVIQIPEDMVYPCFVKPLESITGYKSEMAVCKSKSALLKHLYRLRSRRYNRNVLVQEYLEIDREIDLSGVCIDQNILIPAVIRKTCVAKYEKGVTLSGMLFPFEDMGEHCQKIIEMLKKFHYTGMFDMEFHVAGENVYFNEVNFRSGGPNYSYYVSGANLPHVFVSEITEGRHDPEDAVVKKFGLNFIYEKVAWEDYLNGYMKKTTFQKRMKDADFGLLNDKEDPAPYKYKLKEYKQQEFRKELQKRKIRFKNTKWLRWIKKKADYLKKKIAGYPQYFIKNKRPTYNRRPRVMVAGRNYSSNLSIARSVGEAGYDVEVMRVYQTRPPKNDRLKWMQPERFSKYVKAYYVVITGREDRRLRDKLIAYADRKHKMLLIPADDLVASVADKYYNTLKKYYILPNILNEQGEINRVMSKEEQKKLAEAAGLPVIHSCTIRAERGNFTIPDTVQFPCFMKPNVSRLAAKSRMHRCDTREELEGWLTVYSERKEVSMVVEDYVEIAKEYSILGVSTKNGAIGPAVFEAVRGGKEEHRGVALTGRILEKEKLQPLADQLIAFVGSINFDGLYDIDLIETTDGKIYFVEINMRLGASGYAFTKCGVNLPALYADYMIYHKPIVMEPEEKGVGKIFVSEKVLLDEYAGGRLGNSERKAIMNEADICFVKDETDKKVYRYFKKYFSDAAKIRREAEKNKEPELSVQEQRKQVEDRAVASVMEKAFWTEERSREDMNFAKENYHISFVRYDSENLWRISHEELPVYLKEQELLHLQREQSLASVMKKTGWDYDKAVGKMRTARRKTGASYLLYDALNLWKFPDSAQQIKFIRCMEQTGCTEEEYDRYRLGRLRAARRADIFLQTTSNKLNSKYNTDPAAAEALENREKFYLKFRRFLGRVWAATSKLSPEQFAEAFDGCSQILYRAMDEKQDREVRLFSINPYNALDVYRELASMDEGIVEECLVQHPELERLSPGAMTKLRIVTISSGTEPVTEDGAYIDIAYAVIRIGVENVQNHQLYNGELSAAIDLENGTIATSAADENCIKYDNHPTSGIAFKDYPIPLFAEAVQLVKTIVEKNQLQGYIGWDLVITQKKPVLVEATTHPSPVLVSAPWFVEKSSIKGRMERYLKIDEVIGDV